MRPIISSSALTGCYLFRSMTEIMSPTVRRRKSSYEYNDMDYEFTYVYYHEHLYVDGTYQ